MYFGDPVEEDFQPYVSIAPPSKELHWKQTLTQTKRLDTRPKYPKRCKKKKKNQKNLFRLSFIPDLANCGRLTEIDFTHWRQRFSTTRNVFYWSTGRAMHLGWTWAFKGTVSRFCAFSEFWCLFILSRNQTIRFGRNRDVLTLLSLLLAVGPGWREAL